jgi:LmbE family N-acetylglucosaminyl deacetylase
MRVVVIAPHPDDLEIFCGGTVIKHIRGGDKVIEILATDGQRGSFLNFLRGWKPSQELARRRRAEAERSASFLGVELRALGLMDRELTPKTVPLLQKALRKESPDLIYAPDPEFTLYSHPDHLTAGRAASPFRPVRFYHTAKPNLRVDIGEVLKEKKEAIKIHRSQWSVWRLTFPLRGQRISNPFEDFRELR